MVDDPKIRHNPTVPFDYGTLIEDAATFYVNNKVYEGFTNISLTRNMLSLTGTFEITLVDKWRAEKADFEIKPGDRIHCHLGKLPLFEGWVDRFSISLSTSSRNISLSGRDRTSDLIDCSIQGNSEYNDLDFLGIATELLRPFNLKAISSVDVGKAFSKFTIRQGETIFEALERAAKERQLLLMSTTHGNLLIDKKGSQRAAGELIEGVNVLSANATFDNAERFSEYTVKGQTPGILGGTDDATKGQGKSFDKGIKRFRPIIVLAENAVDKDAAQKRAEFESSYRAANGTKVSVTVQGWRQKDGSLWQANQIIHVDVRSIGLKSDMLVSSVTFTQSENGRTSAFELIRPDAFEFKTEIKAEDDPLSSIGWDA